MSGVDFAGVLAGHDVGGWFDLPSGRYAKRCICGESLDVRALDESYRAHLASVIDAAVSEWLGSEEVRERVTSVEPGCTCGGVAACQQCQDRDAAHANPPAVQRARALREAVLSIRRFAESKAITAKALGHEDRDWLDLLILCDRADALAALTEER